MGLLKLQNNFPPVQYHINDHDGIGWGSIDKNSNQIIEFLRKSFTYKQMEKNKPETSHVICTEFVMVIASGHATTHTNLEKGGLGRR